MRIALVGPTHPYKGGIAQHTTLLARQLAADGHDVEIVSWSAQYPARLYPGQQRVPLNRPEIEPWPATSYPLAWHSPAGWWREGRRLRREADAVVVVAVTPVQAPAYITLLSATRQGRGRRPRLMALCHNVLPHESRFVDRPLVRRMLGLVDAVLVHSQPEADKAASLTAAQVDVTALPPLLGQGERAAGGDDPTEVRRRLLFFGLVRPYKGLDVLLRALATLDGVELIVAGEFWGGTGETQELVRKLGLEDRVELRPGYVDAADVPGLFTGVDALVLPYRSATSSGNVYLGFEHGVPVVATSVGALAEQIRDGEDGLVCAPDVDDLAATLRRLYDEPGLLARLRANIRPHDSAALWRGYAETLVARLRPRSEERL